MPIVRRKHKPGEAVSAKAKRNLEEIAKMRDEDIDTSDIPEWTPEMFAKAEIGKFYRPKKTPVTIRLDADVLAWLKASGEGYQTRINSYLREIMRGRRKAS